MMKINIWKLEPTGSNADCRRMDGIWSVMVPVMTYINILAFKALLLCLGTGKCLRVSPAQ